jgi:hypothetical protein
MDWALRFRIDEKSRIAGHRVFELNHDRFKRAGKPEN